MGPAQYNTCILNLPTVFFRRLPKGHVKPHWQYNQNILQIQSDHFMTLSFFAPQLNGYFWQLFICTFLDVIIVCGTKWPQWHARYTNQTVPDSSIQIPPVFTRTKPRLNHLHNSDHWQWTWMEINNNNKWQTWTHKHPLCPNIMPIRYDHTWWQHTLCFYLSNLPFIFNPNTDQILANTTMVITGLSIHCQGHKVKSLWTSWSQNHCSMYPQNTLTTS